MPEPQKRNRRRVQQGFAPGRPAYPEDQRRNRRAGKPPARARRGLRPLVVFALVLFLAAGLAFGLAYAGQQRAGGRLQALKDEREAVRQAHEADIQYYVGMRKRSGFIDLIERYAQEFQVDKSFISAVIARESSYQKDAMAESTGALGLMQVMKDTGEWVAMRLGVPNYSYDRLREPELNIRFGAWYINYLSAHFDGDPVMTAAAYHAGANNVKQWALDLSPDRRTITLDMIPKDNTRDYVRKVMTAYALYYEYDTRP